MNEQKTEMKKLYRSQVNRFISGVCGGLGEYFEVDANLFRILFVILTFLGGIGVVLYIAAMLIVPENPEQMAEKNTSEKDKTVFWALLFIVIGLALLFREFGFFDYFHFWHIPWSLIWAIFLIVIGVLLIISVNKSSGTVKEAAEKNLPLPEIDKIHRSRDNRMIAGVCAGIAEYFNIDPAIVRLLWVLASLASVGLGILVYILLIFVFPSEPEHQDTG